MNDQPQWGPSPSWRDYGLIQRELGAFEARDRAFERELAELRAGIVRIESKIDERTSALGVQMERQLGGLRAEILSEMSRAKSEQDEARRTQNRIMLVLALLAGAALGLDGLQKLGLL